MKRLCAISVVVYGFVFFFSCRNTMPEAQKGEGVMPPVEVAAEVDKATATTGDRIRYTLSASSKPGIVVDIPEMGSQIAGLRIVDMGEEGPIERDGLTFMKKWYQLKADLVGSYVIPGAVFYYTNENGERKEIKTAQIFVEVKSVLEDKETANDIRDIKPIATIKRDYALLVGYVVASLLLLVLIAASIYVYRVKFQKVKVLPLRPAHELALEELDRLQKEGLIGKGIYKEHYFKLSEIFRRYLERRFGFQAVEKTTEEILPEIKGLKGFDEHVKRGAENFLYNTDLVKFAKHIPETSEIDQEYQETIDFINQTKEEQVQQS